MNQKCSTCKHMLFLDEFNQKANGTYQKTCIECLAKTKKYDTENKCPHGINGYLCKICKEEGIGGEGICKHGNQKQLCKICKEEGTGGEDICEHNTHIYYCKICSDAKKITIKNMISHSKQADKKYNKYDEFHHIDKDFLEGLLDKYTHCYYDDCNVELQIMTRQDNMATIERLDNNIGHIKSNCVICCWKCNLMKKSNM